MPFLLKMLNIGSGTKLFSCHVSLAFDSSMKIAFESSVNACRNVSLSRFLAASFIVVYRMYLFRECDFKRLFKRIFITC